MPRVTNKEALAAAKLSSRSPRLKNRKAIMNLAKYAAEMGLCDHDNEEDEWDVYEARKAREREMDPIDTELDVDGSTPRLAEQDVKDRIIAAKIEEVGRCEPSVFLRAAAKAQKSVDSTHIDYRDPELHFWTRLHKHVKDRNIAAVKFAVEVEKASIDIRNINGKTPLGMAINLGYMEIANYLGEKMRERHGHNTQPLLKIA